MGQRVKGKKKGRPSKADLAPRPTSSLLAKESEVRRSIRRRNVRYDIDYYEEYFDKEDEEEEEEEEERRREKKLKLVVKLNQRSDSAEPASRSRSSARSGNASDDEEEDEEDKPLKKRKINASDLSASEEEENNYDDDEEERGTKVRSKGHDSAPGTPNDRRSVIPLPDKKPLELILDKLQKKDIYGVYAEPVDPEELPDYHELIEHPMDFTTVRMKLANGSYSTLEQFESDVFLICSNAMQYNTPDTIYHKQAHAIQELAKKKFHRLRVGIERSEKELKPEKELEPQKGLKVEKELKLEKDPKSEQNAKSNILGKKQIKKPSIRTMPEPVGSDFSSGATLATTGDIQNGSVATQPGVCEKPSTIDALADGNSFLVDNNLEAEELSSGKGLSKLVWKQSVLYENRRVTYDTSSLPVVRSESVFTTFEGEIKQLVVVGLQAEYSYARSLACFAATLGPVAWKVASQRIKQALPAGYKFGRGWVGEYEPLPTPVLMLETHTQKERAFFSKLQSPAFRVAVPAKVHPVNEPNSEFHPANGSTPEEKTLYFTSAGKKPSTPVNALNQQHNPFSRANAETEGKVSRQVELNLPPSASQSTGDLGGGKPVSVKLEAGGCRSIEMVPRNMNLLQSLPTKQPTTNGVGGGGFPHGIVTSNCGNTRVTGPSSDDVRDQMARAATFFPQGPKQGLSDPVQLMKIVNEKAQKQQNSSNQSPINSSPVMPSVPSVRRDGLSNAAAAAAAARAWMSNGAGGFKPPTENSLPKNLISVDSSYNSNREFHTQISRVRGEFPLSAGMQFQTENRFPPQGFTSQPVCVVNEAQFRDRRVVFPQLVTNDFARVQMPSAWQGLSPRSQPRQRQEGLPPDLNISFQSPGSPVKQSSGVLVDSQQPDLALQL